MKLNFPIALLMLAVVDISTPVQAGPSCDVRPNHPNCEPNGDDPGPVYWVDFSNIETGEWFDEDIFVPGIYTTPGTLDGDESGLNANPNGPNEVKFILHNFLTTALGEEGYGDCFPAGERLSGSIQLQDNHVSSGDPNRVGYIWVHALDASGNNMQYAIDMFDMTGSWNQSLLPSINATSTRTVTHWELRRTKKKNVVECVTDGLVEEIGANFTITVERVGANPWYE